MTQRFCVFIHVPKTAGTALKTAFIKSLPHQVIWYRAVEADVQQDVQYVSSMHDHRLLDAPMTFRLFGGHFTAKQLPPAITAVEPLYLAVIRDPVARAKSYYAYVQATPQHGMHEALKNMSLLEAIEHKPFYRQITNGQMTALSPDGDLLDLRKNIQKMHYIVGKHEELASFVAALNKHAGIAIKVAKKLNATPANYQSELEQQPGFAEAIARLKLLNVYEYEFYNSFDKVLVSKRLREASVEKAKRLLGQRLVESAS